MTKKNSKNSTMLLSRILCNKSLDSYTVWEFPIQSISIDKDEILSLDSKLLVSSVAAACDIINLSNTVYHNTTSASHELWFCKIKNIWYICTVAVMHYNSVQGQ